MATVRVKRSEVASPQGELSLGTTVICPRTALVLGRVEAVNADGTVDVYVVDDRVGEVMTQVRGPQLLPFRGTIENFRSQIRFHRGPDIWHAHFVHGGVGYVGTGGHPGAARQALLRQLPGEGRVEATAAECIRHTSGDPTQTGFPIVVREQGHDFRVCLAGHWDMGTFSRRTLAAAVQDFRAAMPEWRLAEKVQHENSGTEEWDLTDFQIVCRKVNARGAARWTAGWESWVPTNPSLIRLGTASSFSPERAAAFLFADAQNNGLIVPSFSGAVPFQIVNPHGEPFPIQCERNESDGMWSISSPDLGQIPIVVADREEGVRQIRRLHPKVRFGSVLSTMRNVPLSTNLTLPNRARGQGSNFVTIIDGSPSHNPAVGEMWYNTQANTMFVQTDDGPIQMTGVQPAPASSPAWDIRHNNPAPVAPESLPRVRKSSAGPTRSSRNVEI